MKKLILTLTMVASLGASFGADIGRLNFNNSASSLVTLQHFWLGNLGPMPGTLGQFKFELFVAPAGTTDPSLFASTGLFGTNVATPGRFIGGNNLAIPGVLAGETRSILVRGWSTGLGHDYATAKANWDLNLNGFLGESAIAPNIYFGGFDGNANYPTPSVFGGDVGIQGGFALVGVPEPATATILGLGLLGLAHFRRKR